MKCFAADLAGKRMTGIAKLRLARTGCENLATFAAGPLQRNIRQSARRDQIGVLFPKSVICSGVTRIAKRHKVLKSIRFSVIIVQMKRPNMMYVKVASCSPAFLAGMTIALQRITPLACPIRATIGDIPAFPIRAIFSTIRCRCAPRISTLAAAERVVTRLAALARCHAAAQVTSDCDTTVGTNTCLAAVVDFGSLGSIALFLKRFAAGGTSHTNTFDLGRGVAFAAAECLAADVESCSALVGGATMGASKIAHIRHYTAKCGNFQVRYNYAYAQLPAPIVYGKITPRAEAQERMELEAA